MRKPLKERMVLSNDPQTIGCPYAKWNLTESLHILQEFTQNGSQILKCKKLKTSKRKWENLHDLWFGDEFFTISSM